MRHSESIDVISPALVAARKEIVAPVRTHMGLGENGDEYFYADLSDDIKASEGPLLAHGIMVMQESITSPTHLITTTRLQHESGQFFESEPLELERLRNTVWDTGALMTFARRYQLEAILYMSAQFDDDAADVARKQRTAKQPSPQAPVGSPQAAPPSGPPAGASPRKDPTQAQKAGITRRVKKLGWTDEKLASFKAAVLGPTGSSTTTSADASKLIDALEREIKKAAS